MSVRLLRDIRVAGAAVAANTTVALGRGLEAELVSQGLATHVVKLGPPSSDVQIFGGLPIVNPRGLRRWGRAYGDRATVPPRVLWLGDSWPAGIGSDGNNNASQSDATADPLSAPGQMRKIFARMLGANEMGFIHAGASGNTLGGAPAVSNTTGFLGNPLATSCGALRINNTPKSITIPVPKCTDIEIYYYESNGANSTPTTGAWKWNCDAAGDNAVANGGGNNLLKKVSITGLSDATHSLVITGTAASDAYIAGIIYFTSAGPGVIVSRMGLGSATSGDLFAAYLSGTTGSIIASGANAAANAITRTRMLQALTVTAPDLVILMCGHNDASQQALGVGTTPDVYQANLATIIETIVAAGACVWLISEPDPPTRFPVAGGHDVRAYWPKARELATDGSHVAHSQLYDVWGDWATANANLLHTQAASSVHGSRKGYGTVASVGAGALMQIAAAEFAAS